MRAAPFRQCSDGLYMGWQRVALLRRVELILRTRSWSGRRLFTWRRHR